MYVFLCVQELQKQLRLAGDGKVQLLGRHAEPVIEAVKSHSAPQRLCLGARAPNIIKRLVRGISNHRQELHSMLLHASAVCSILPGPLHKGSIAQAHTQGLYSYTLHGCIQQNLQQLDEGLSTFATDPQKLSEEVSQLLQAFLQDSSCRF